MRSVDSDSKVHAKQLEKLVEAASSKAKDHMDTINTNLRLVFERQQQAGIWIQSLNYTTCGGSWMCPRLTIGVEESYP